MAKPSQGRFDGVHGMRKFTAEDLFALAALYEARIKHRLNIDDPKWLQRRADRIRRVATAKQKAAELKARERTDNRPLHPTAATSRVLESQSGG